MEQIEISIILPDWYSEDHCNRISFKYSQTHGNYNHKIPSGKL